MRPVPPVWGEGEAVHGPLEPPERDRPDRRHGVDRAPDHPRRALPIRTPEAARAGAQHGPGPRRIPPRADGGPEGDLPAVRRGLRGPADAGGARGRRARSSDDGEERPPAQAGHRPLPGQGPGQPRRRRGPGAGPAVHLADDGPPRADPQGAERQTGHIRLRQGVSRRCPRGGGPSPSCSRGRPSGESRAGPPRAIRLRACRGSRACPARTPCSQGAAPRGGASPR